MKVGVPSEIKAQESRVGLTPQSVKELTKDSHTVLIQNNRKPILYRNNPF